MYSSEEKCNNIDRSSLCQIASIIVDLVFERKCITFADIDNALDELDIPYRGEWGEIIQEHVFICCGYSIEFLNGLRQALNFLDVLPCDILAYKIDDAVPDMPIADVPRTYESDHWLPVILCLKRQYLA